MWNQDFLGETHHLNKRFHSREIIGPCTFNVTFKIPDKIWRQNNDILAAHVATWCNMEPHILYMVLLMHMYTAYTGVLWIVCIFLRLSAVRAALKYACFCDKYLSHLYIFTSWPFTAWIISKWSLDKMLFPKYFLQVSKWNHIHKCTENYNFLFF